MWQQKFQHTPGPGVFEYGFIRIVTEENEFVELSRARPAPPHSWSGRHVWRIAPSKSQ